MGSWGARSRALGSHAPPRRPVRARRAAAKTSRSRVAEVIAARMGDDGDMRLPSHAGVRRPGREGAEPRCRLDEHRCRLAERWVAGRV